MSIRTRRAARHSAPAHMGPDAGTEQTKYNGWPTYETWLVYTWLTNDAGTDREVRELATTQDDGYQAADALKQYVEDSSPLVDEASLATDLLGAALGRVDWLAIARHFRADTEGSLGR
jgi:hypothetical protein